MNFKAIAIAAGLALAAGASFAADIDFSAVGTTSLDGATVLGFADTAMTAADSGTVTQAIIFQDGVDGSGGDVIAHIDQVGVTASFALIYQGSESAANSGTVAYIGQNATNNARAVITQR